MKKRRILPMLVLSLLVIPTLSSCSLGAFNTWEIPTVENSYIRPSGERYNETIEYYKKAINYNDEEQIKGYYEQLQDYLNYVLDLKKAVSHEQIDLGNNDINDEINFLYNYYWDLKIKEVEATKKDCPHFLIKKLYLMF